MDILFLNWKDLNNPEVGGAEIIAFEFAKRLASEGHTITLFSRSFEDALEKEIIDSVHVVRRGNRFSVYFEAFLYYRSLSHKPDVVIDMINTLCWQTPLYVPREKRLAYVNQLAKEVLFFEFPWPLSWIAYFLERYEYLPYKDTRFICYSKSTKEDLQSFGIPSKNISTFPLGLDHKRYIPGKKKSSFPLFIFVARLVKMKRADLCIKAMKQVVKKYNNAKLVIIGSGQDEKRLRSIVETYELTNHVTFLTKDTFYFKKDHKDKKVTLMQEAWAHILPSVKEGWGMVVTEAAACGTPSIVSDVTGLRDSVQKNKSGIILSKNPTETELADSMVRLIENKQLRDKLTKQSIEWANTYDWDTSYKEFKKVVLNTHTK